MTRCVFCHKYQRGERVCDPNSRPGRTFHHTDCFNWFMVVFVTFLVAFARLLRFDIVCDALGSTARSPEEPHSDIGIPRRRRPANLKSKRPPASWRRSFIPVDLFTFAPSGDDQLRPKAPFTKSSVLRPRVNGSQKSCHDLPCAVYTRDSAVSVEEREDARDALGI
jgi:hypothetical protein